MNKVVLVGRLTKSPELRYTSQGTAVAGFTLAVNRRVKKDQEKQQADFVQIVVWGTMGENCSKYLNKGNQAAISGRIQTRNYENKEGKKVYVTEIVAEEVQFLDSKKDSNNNQEEFGTPTDDFYPIEDDDDMPF